MKTCRHLILLAIFGTPLLSGCNLFGYGDNGNAVVEPATFDAATFDNTTWE